MYWQCAKHDDGRVQKAEQFRLYSLHVLRFGRFFGASYRAFGTWWHTVTHGRGSEGERCEWSGQPAALFCTSEHGLYNRCPLIRIPRLLVIDWTDTPADLNGLVTFRWKTKSGFCACAITFRTCYTNDGYLNCRLEQATRQCCIRYKLILHGLPDSLRYEKTLDSTDVRVITCMTYNHVIIWRQMSDV